MVSGLSDGTSTTDRKIFEGLGRFLCDDDGGQGSLCCTSVDQLFIMISLWFSIFSVWQTKVSMVRLIEKNLLNNLTNGRLFYTRKYTKKKKQG